jgi:vesicle-associated membrane protein 7
MLPNKVLTVQNGYLLLIIFLQVRSVMIDNIDKVLERGDRLELLVDKTANMQGNTVRFKRQARRFRNTVWWRNVKLTYVIF